MSTKHTPGPWVVEPDTGATHVPRVTGGPSGYGVAVICINRRLGERGPSAEELANAHLVAAAPDLLAALEAAEGVTQWAMDHNAQCGAVLRMVRDAIARAKGDA